MTCSQSECARCPFVNNQMSAGATASAGDFEEIKGTEFDRTGTIEVDEETGLPLDIPPLDLRTLKADGIALLVGRRGMGKSTLLRSIAYYLQDKLDIVYGVNQTEVFNKTLAEFMHSGFISDELDFDQLERFMKMVKAYGEKGEYDGRNHVLRVGLIFDDALDDAGVFRKKVVKQIHKMGRHYKVFIITTAQYIIDYPKDCRTQVEYVFAFYDGMPANVEGLYENFFKGIFPKLRIFTNYFREISSVMRDPVTKKILYRDALVLEPNAPDGNVIKFCRADPTLPHFVLGRPIYRLAAEHFLDPTKGKPDTSQYEGKTETAAAAAAAAGATSTALVPAAAAAGSSDKKKSKIVPRKLAVPKSPIIIPVHGSSSSKGPKLRASKEFERKYGSSAKCHVMSIV